MSEMNIELLYPEITVQIWQDRYQMDRDGNKYTMKEQLVQWVETDQLLFYIWDELFDTEDRRIVLRPWDVLHIEYILKCLRENGWSDMDKSTAS